MAYQEEYVKRLEAEVEALKTERRQRSPRQFFAWVFLGLGVMALIPASMLIWANRTITDPDRYLAVTGPLIEQQSVQNAITKAADDAIFGSADIEGAVAGALPPNGQFLAAPIATQVHGFATKTISQIVGSEQFAKVWVGANQRAQERFMRIAESGRTSPVVNVRDIYANISQRLEDTRLAPLANRQLPDRIGDIEVFSSPALVQVPHYMAVLSDLSWIFFALAVGCMVLALAVAVRRRHMAAAVGWGWIIAAMSTLLVMRFMGDALLGKVADPTYRAAADTIWDGFMRPLLAQTAVLAAGGLAIVISAWVAGPSRAAIRIRVSVRSRLALWRHKVLPAFEHSGTVDYVQTHHSVFLWAVLVIGMSLVILFAPLTAWSFVGILAAMLLGLLCVEFLSAPFFETS